MLEVRWRVRRLRRALSVVCRWLLLRTVGRDDTQRRTLLPRRLFGASRGAVTDGAVFTGSAVRAGVGCRVGFGNPSRPAAPPHCASCLEMTLRTCAADIGDLSRRSTPALVRAPAIICQVAPLARKSRKRSRCRRATRSNGTCPNSRCRSLANLFSCLLIPRSIAPSWNSIMKARSRNETSQSATN